MKLKLLFLVVCLAMVATAFGSDLLFEPQDAEPDTPNRSLKAELLGFGLAMGPDEYDRWATLRVLTVIVRWNRLRIGTGLADVMIDDPFMTTGEHMFLPVRAGLTLWSRPRKYAEDQTSGWFGMIPDLYIEATACPWGETDPDHGPFPVRASLCCDLEYGVGLRAECGYMFNRLTVYGGLQLSLGTSSITKPY